MLRKNGNFEFWVSLSKAKVEVWCLVVLMITGSMVFLWMNSLPTPTTNLERIASSDATGKLKSQLKECEDKIKQTKLLYADKFGELLQFRQKEESKISQLVKENLGTDKLSSLELEMQKLKKENEELRLHSSLDLSIAKKNIEAILDSQTEGHTVTRRMLEISNYLPTYDPNTMGSNPSYEIHKEIKCWAPDCLPEILNNRHAYANCSNSLATTWNAVGMKYMERFVAKPKDYTTLGFDHKRYRDEAFYAFQNATAIDGTCWRAEVNWALLFMQFGDAPKAIEHLKKSIETEGNDARTWVILGLAQDQAGEPDAAQISWAKALQLDPFIGERKYFGIMLVDDMVPERHIQPTRIHQINRDFEIPTAVDVITFIEFSPVSVSNYALLHPGTQEFFVKNQFVILRDIIPPFILNAVANCFKNLRTHGFLQLEDNDQSKRYTTNNCRTGRTLHYQIVDLLRRVVVHNLHPSYSFYGGYIGGAQLVPHSDKPQCEFTVSLTLSQYPADAEPWALSLGKIPKFAKDDNFVGNGNEMMPPEDEVVDAYLYPGDCLLFMGRHLVHFRRNELPQNHELDQIFLHNVREEWEGIYDI